MADKPVPLALMARGIQRVTHRPPAGAGEDHTAAVFTRLFGQELLARIEARACPLKPSSISDSK